MRETMPSAFFATLTMAMISTIHGSTESPVGTVESTDSSIFTKTTFSTIRRHIEPYILHQPVKMSFVSLLPPMPNASGAQMVSTARMKYRSAIAAISLND